MLDCRTYHLCSALDARELRRMAIRLPLCDRDLTVSVCDNAGEFAKESHSTRMGRLFSIIRAQCLRDLVVSLEQLSPYLVERRVQFLGFTY